IAGRVNERFMVRGSGARSVVEGCGDYGCEYMSGGVAVVLGKTGQFFGSGMKGGLAFVYDGDGTAQRRINKNDTTVSSLDDSTFEAPLRALIEKHLAETGSTKAQSILSDWEHEKQKFKVVIPNDVSNLAKRPEYRVDMNKFFAGQPAAKKVLELVA